MIHSINNFLLNKISVSPSYSGPCDDNYVGNIEYDGNLFKGYQGENLFGLQSNAQCLSNNFHVRIKVDYTSFSPISNKRKIVVLLESPHVDEFNSKLQNVSTGPALGHAGYKFNAQCIRVFNNNIGSISSALALSNNSEIFDIYFVNAIQYQCSLGQKPIKPKLRDFVFEALWNRQPNSFKDDLINRLNIIKPDLIINACTRELQKTCCNGNSIMGGLKGFSCSFLTASNHILCWSNKTILL